MMTTDYEPTNDVAIAGLVLKEFTEPERIKIIKEELETASRLNIAFGHCLVYRIATEYPEQFKAIKEDWESC